MTDEERRRCEAYLPSPPDPDLGTMEYYVLDSADRVRHVYITDLLSCKDSMEYGVREVGTERRIDPGWDDPWRGFRKGLLYDNRTDCKHREHDWFDGWEILRDLQRKEGLI